MFEDKEPGGKIAEHTFVCEHIFPTQRHRHRVRSYILPNSTILFEDKDPALIAETIAAVLDDDATRQALLTRQRGALDRIAPQTVLKALMGHLLGLSEAK